MSKNSCVETLLHKLYFDISMISKNIFLALQTQLTERSARSSSSDLNNVTIIPMNGSGSTRSSTPNSLNNDNPVNLSMPRKSNSVGSGQNSEDSEESVFIGQAASALGRKRRKQTQVPEESKDER